MSDRPWGAHGQDVPSHTVTPNPTPSDSPTAFAPSEEAAIPVQGGGGGLGAVIINIVASLFMLAILWIPMVCLYPVTAVAGISAALITRPIFATLLPADAGDVPFALAIVVAAVVFWQVFRIEFRLASDPRYRRIRHVVRMVLLAIWVIPIIELSTGVTAPGTSTRFIFDVVSSPRAIAAFFAVPLNLGLWIAAVVGLHFLIWKSEWARRVWHGRLRWIALK